MKRHWVICLFCAVLIAAVPAALSSCKDRRAPVNAEASTASDSRVAGGVEKTPEAPPDPENTARFSLVYTNNLKAEYEACG